jgi:hypothetical protein
MKPGTRKRLIIAFSSLLILGAIIFAAYLYVLSRIKEKVEDQLSALKDSGYIVKYDSITVDSDKNEVAIYRLSVKRALDTSSCASTDFFSAKYIKATGFKLFPLIFKKHLSFNSLAVDSPKVVLHKSFFEKEKSGTPSSGRKEFAVKITHLTLPGLRFEFMDSSACEPAFRYRSNNEIEDFVLAFYSDRDPFFNISSFHADSTRIDFRDELYSMKIQETLLDVSRKAFSLDTLTIIPHYPKIAFGRKTGKEVDRFEGIVPYINLYDLSIGQHDSLTVTAGKMTTQFFIKVFRDKRLPFRNPYKPLPIESIMNLPFGLSIDSLMVNKSFVQYEEFAQEADSSGLIFFDDIYATVKNIGNTNLRNRAEATIVAECKLMGDGKLHVNGSCPVDPMKNYKVNGYLRSMDMRKLNSMLEPQARMRVESGQLHQLTFGFSYNNTESQGQLHLDYNDLKVLTFRSEEQAMKKIRKKRKKGEDVNENQEMARKSAFKTFVVNNFILKKDLDSKDPQNKGTGTIAFQRDKHKSIFNYWVKSMLSGIKSAYNIDKLQDSKIKKLVDKKPKD